MIDMETLDYLITTQKLIVEVFDKNIDHSRDIYLLLALKDYQKLRLENEKENL